MYDKHLRGLLTPFPPDSWVRRIGKRLVRGMALRQDFYGGSIYFDAVGQSWAFKDLRYEKLDAGLRNHLLALSQGRRYFIDIGCNVGAMTLSVVLRNKDIQAVAADPNAHATALFKKSIRKNHLERRVKLIEAAVGEGDGIIHMCFEGKSSEMVYVAPEGKKVRCVDFVELLNEYSSEKCLVKMDVEGFETSLLRRIGQVKHRENTVFVVELHNLGYNAGNPDLCAKLLRDSGAVLRDLEGREITALDQSQMHQVVAQWRS